MATPSVAGGVRGAMPRPPRVAPSMIGQGEQTGVAQVVLGPVLLVLVLLRSFRAHPR